MRYSRLQQMWVGTNKCVMYMMPSVLRWGGRMCNKRKHRILQERQHSSRNIRKPHHFDQFPHCPCLVTDLALHQSNRFAAGTTLQACTRYLFENAQLTRVHALSGDF